MTEPSRKIHAGHVPAGRMPLPNGKATPQAESRPQIGVAGATAGLKLLLEIESTARRATNLQELYFVIANETRKLTRARQIFVFDFKMGHMRLKVISGLPNVDHNAPFVQDIDHAISDLGRSNGYTTRHNWLIADAQSAPKTLTVYPFPHLLWLPFLSRKNELLGGMLLVREETWTEADIAVASRLAETYQHAVSAMVSTPQASWRRRLLSGRRRYYALAVLVGLAALMAIPVPMSVLAPMEIAPHKPFIVAAPIEGVVDDVLVDPGAVVKKDEPIIRFSDTVLRNRLEVAQRAVEVAKAELKKANQQAFNDTDGRSDLRSAMADLALKNAELKFAKDMLGRATIKAQRAGVAVFSDKTGLIGKPVSIGERIMEIADPKQIEIEIELAVEDALVLKQSARAKIFLDSDPVHAREAHIAFSDYQAHQTAGNKLAFRVVAAFDDADAPRPRIGVRGTAQIYGDSTFLGFYLFRRPLSALRQWIGL